MAEKLKITYATLNDSNEEIHTGYEAGLAQARALMGSAHGNFINGSWSTAGDSFVKKSPIDGSVVGTFSKGDRSTAKAAIAAAKAAYPLPPSPRPSAGALPKRFNAPLPESLIPSLPSRGPGAPIARSSAGHAAASDGWLAARRFAGGAFLADMEGARRPACPRAKRVRESRDSRTGSWCAERMALPGTSSEKSVC